MTSRSAYHVEPWPPPGDWVDDALCTQVDPEMFFPHSRSGAYPTRDAVAICGDCPVQDACLRYVMANEKDWARDGIWGGLTATQRHELHKRVPR